MMTLAQLRAFRESLRTGSFTAAADELEVTQATISEAVSRLENEFDVVLFNRKPRGLIPTQAARDLLPYVEQILGTVENADKHMRAVKGLVAGTASFGVPRNGRFYGLSKFIAKFRQQYPQVNIRMLGINSHSVAQAVKEGELEAGLVVLPVDTEDLVVEPLYEDEVVVVSGAPLFRETVTTAALNDAGLILYDASVGSKDPTRRQLVERAQREGIELHAVIEVDQVETALELVRQQLGVTMVSRSVLKEGDTSEGLVISQFEPALKETLAIVHRQGAVLSPATAEMIAFVRAELLALEAI